MSRHESFADPDISAQASERSRFMTLGRHIDEGERAHPEATGDFTGLLSDLAIAVKLIWREVSKAGLIEIIGTTDRQNESGDEVRKLDEFANQTIYRAMGHGDHLCAMVSEESQGIMTIPDKYPEGKYILVFDPIDGSTNIDANVSIGSIFGIYRRVTTTGHGTEEDCLQPGYKLAAAAYVIYGSSTIFVYSTGNGVHGFTLDPSVGEFLLSHENMRIPKRGKTYSVNEGNYARWDENVRSYVGYLKDIDPTGKRPYTSRYIGSLVADLHRNILHGGIFLYPDDASYPEGKLRLVYECAPLSYIVEQAGGRASDGHRRILDIVPTTLHQRTPLYIGSEDDVKEVEDFLRGKRMT